MLVGEKIIAHCRAAGVLSYRKRVLIAKTLEELNTAATADELWFKVRIDGNKVSFPAVYVILNWLISNGFVEKQQDQRSMRYIIRA